MPASKIDGTAIAASIRAEIKSDVQKIIALQDPELFAAAEAVKTDAAAPAFNDSIMRPGLAVVIVGTRGDSQTYVRLKEKSAIECYFRSVKIELPEAVRTDELIAHVQRLNDDKNINGILVQLPLPAHIDEPRVLDAISPEKDVDGLHPTNVGSLYLRGRTPFAVPCTPQGVIELLKRSNVAISGKRAVVLGRSNIVGLPVAQLLLQENATVTVCHSKTPDIPSIVKEADIVVAAVGSPAMVKGSWLKPGAVCIDVGTNPVPDSTKPSGFRLVGDCCPSCADVASQLTPVPGGVGPMTIAMLLKNTLVCFRRQNAEKLAQVAAKAKEQHDESA